MNNFILETGDIFKNDEVEILKKKDDVLVRCLENNISDSTTVREVF